MCTLCGCKQSSCSSTKWWSNLQCFLLSSCCTWTSRNKNFFSCLDELWCCCVAPCRPTQAAPRCFPSSGHTFEKQKKLKSDLFTLRSQGRQNMYSPKKKTVNHYRVECFVPRRYQRHRGNSFNSIHEKLRDCNRISLQLHVTPLQLILNVPPLQLIRPPVSGLPAAPTCQQGLVIMTSSYQSPNPFSTHITLLSCNSHGHSAWFLLSFLPRACAKHFFYA